MARLRYVGPREARSRLAQGWHRLAETQRPAVIDHQRALGRLIAPREGDLRAIGRGLRRGEAEAGADLLEHFRERPGPQFVTSPAERSYLQSAMAARCPEEQGRLFAEADLAREHRFHTLGLGMVAYGPQVSWQADPASGRQWPRRRWWQVPHLAGDPGDVKLVWELNRLRPAVALARAWWLRADPADAAAAVELALAWLRENRPGWGVNWASSLEVAFRGLALLWVHQLCLGSEAMTPAAHVRTVLGLAQAADHLSRYPSTWTSPNTHLMGEAAALWSIGTMLPELRPARRWREQGEELLDLSCRQVLADGGHCELATGYHRYALEIYEFCTALAQRNGHTPTRWLDAVEAMAEWLAALAGGDGQAPRLGDSDGGSAAFGPDREEADCRHVLSTAAALLGTPQLARGESSEVLWLLGPAGTEVLDNLPPAQPAAEGRLLSSSGLVVLRDERCQLIFDCGPHGGLGGGHAHADALAVVMSVNDRPALVDRGTYTYTGHPGWRDHFRGTAAHNTVMVDGRSQVEPAGPFRWQAAGRAELLEHVVDPAFELARGSYEQEYRRGQVVRHERAVLLVKGCYGLVLDRVLGSGAYEVALHWHYPPGVGADDRSGALVLWPEGEEVVVEGGPQPGIGWHSPEYGRLEPAPTKRVSRVTALPETFVTVLWHGEQPAAHLAGEAVVVAGEWGEDTVEMAVGLALVRRREGAVTALAAAGKQEVVAGGMSLLRLDRPGQVSVALGDERVVVEGAGFGRLWVRTEAAAAQLGGKPARAEREGDWLVIDEETA